MIITMGEVAISANVLYEKLKVSAYKLSGLENTTKEMSRLGYHHYDKVTINPDEDLSKYAQWHIHTEDEVRWCIGGAGLFKFKYSESVIEVLIELDDAIIIPAKTIHAFGYPRQKLDKPAHFVRFFKNDLGWEPLYLGKVS